MAMSLALRFEKFPDIVRQGRRVVWDSRQASDGREEMVFLLPGAEDVWPQLRARAKSKSIGPVGSGADQEVSDPRALLAAYSAEHFAQPSRDLRLYGVTGTNGKTTCVSLIARALAFSGRKVAQIGTLGVSVWQGADENPLMDVETGFTTPEAPQLQHLLRQLVDAGVTHAALEVSSHALVLRRADACRFAGALFTNLSQDHLDFHGDMARYAAAKERLFTELQPAHSVLNIDDPVGKAYLSRLPLGARVQAYSRRDVREGRADIEGLRFELAEGPLRTRMLGAHNLDNLHGVWTLLRDAEALPFADFAAAVKDYSGPPGRLQRIADTRGRHVFVDYAHTPDALEKQLQALRALLAPKAKLGVVFGCGGDRDPSKRPFMGAVAARAADFVVLTSDNPRGEEPEKIMASVHAGIPADLRSRCESVEDRRSALSLAVSRLSPGDVLLVAGKGHESVQIVGKQKLPFSDAAVCRELLAK